MSTNFAKTFVWKHGHDVKLWRHKQRTPNTNDHHMTLNQTPIKIFCVRHWLWDSRHSHNINMIHATYVFRDGSNFRPTSARCEVLADSNSWNVNGTPNFKTVRQMLRVPSQLASDQVLAQSGVLVSVGLLWTKFQVPNFLFSSLWQLGRGKYDVQTATEIL